MAKVMSSTGPFRLVGHRGDAKTLLAFDLTTAASRKGLAGFTVHIQPPVGGGYYMWNDLVFEKPADHFQDPGEPAKSTLNSPIHKFRWVHVPGVNHQGQTPAFGDYVYTVTPRYFGPNNDLLQLDPTLGAQITVQVAPFVSGKVALGFARGFVQSQAYVRRFGDKIPVRPKGGPLNYKLTGQAGVAPDGSPYTYDQAYDWLGFTARGLVYQVLDAAMSDPQASLDVFAYDLTEPYVIDRLLTLSGQGRVRIILDNASLHSDKTGALPEDQFTALVKAMPNGQIQRGKFGRYAHDKVFVLRRNGAPVKVLTGSTNFSVTGLYVNSNHVLVFDDAQVAQTYGDLFDQVWKDGPTLAKFVKSPTQAKTFTFGGSGVPNTRITFSPHDQPTASAVLSRIVDRAHQETKVAGGKGSVLFAVMEMDGGADNPVYGALSAIHMNQDVFSYGISDAPSGISYYPVGSSQGVLVTGKPANTRLPAPFNQVPNLGAGHQVHHKFVVCGFGASDPTVFCGSSNLALAGEQVNGDNLLEIHDADIATVFAIEALALVDHFNFLDHTATGPKAKTSRSAPPPAELAKAAIDAGWHLGVTDAWVAKFFDPKDLHCKDRVLFS